MTINLIYAAEPKFGGWVSFTEHLYNCLAMQKNKVNLYIIANKFSNLAVPYSGNVTCHKITAQAVQELRGVNIITALDKKTAALFHTIPRNLYYVVHDPTELTSERMPFYLKAKHVFGIRKNMIPVINSKGLKSSYLPHPYCSISPERKVTKNAVAYSRIDWDKHTEMICGANEMLDKKHRCHIYGAENRMYSYHKLDTQYKDWKTNYFGKFPKTAGAGAILAATAKFAVDMSVIKQDGSGSQYTFLEAWDAGTQLILNKKWTLDDSGEMKNNYNCISISDSADLAKALTQEVNETILQNGKNSLVHHEPENVEKELLKVIS